MFKEEEKVKPLFIILLLAQSLQAKINWTHEERLGIERATLAPPPIDLPRPMVIPGDEEKDYLVWQENGELRLKKIPKFHSGQVLLKLLGLICVFFFSSMFWIALWQVVVGNWWMLLRVVMVSAGVAFLVAWAVEKWDKK